MSDAVCRARLESLGITIDLRVKIPAPTQSGCAIVEPVALQSVSGLPGNGPIRFSGTPVLACAMAERLAQFLVDVADPAARQLLNAGITSVDLGPGYTCRPRNNQPGAKLSSHSQGLAVDIASVTLDNGVTLPAGSPVQPEHRLWFDHLTARACVHFNTVLGIGSDAFHANNIHIDLEPRGRDGRTKFCR